MKRLTIAALFTVLFSTTAATAQTGAGAAPTPQTVRSDGPSTIQRTSFLYATREGGQKLYLDRIVDSSVKVAGKRPVIIFSFGGGWESGSRTDKEFAKLFDPYTSIGYEVIAIDYRLGIKIAKDRKEFTPANGVQMYLRAIQWSVEDLFDATSFVVKNAAQWGIDPARLVLMGGSAGATNSLVAEYNVANETALARARLPAKFRYAGVVSMAGAFWFQPNTPLTFKNKPAPIMFFHGAKDQLVTYDQVQGGFSGYGPVYYFRQFAGPDYPKWFVDYPQGDHVIAGTPASDSTNEIKAFLQKLVTERQQLSIHTIEEGKPAKTIETFLKMLSEKTKK